jgi:hypothetical protein
VAPPLRLSHCGSAGRRGETGQHVACRHLIGDQLDITGARWGLEGAGDVHKLRALWSNGDFDT